MKSLRKSDYEVIETQKPSGPTNSRLFIN